MLMSVRRSTVVLIGPAEAGTPVFRFAAVVETATEAVIVPDGLLVGINAGSGLTLKLIPGCEAPEASGPAFVHVTVVGFVATQPPLIGVKFA
jgi:hypothetical protein